MRSPLVCSWRAIAARRPGSTAPALSTRTSAACASAPNAVATATQKPRTQRIDVSCCGEAASLQLQLQPQLPLGVGGGHRAGGLARGGAERRLEVERAAGGVVARREVGGRQSQ